MAAPAFPELSLSWDGAAYRCRPTFDVLAQIEQKVALQKLAYTIVFDRDNVPMTHIAWVMYCLLHGAGAPVTPDGVWRAVRDPDAGVAQDHLAEVMRFVIQETYGVSAEANEPQPGKAKSGGGKRKRKRRRRSSSATSTPSQ